MDERHASVGGGSPQAWVESVATPPLQTLRLLRPSDAEIRAASERIGFELPIQSLRLTCTTPGAARLGPGEWLIRDGSAAELDRLLAHVVHHVSDIGPGRSMWRIAGSGAADLVSSGCSIDLHPSVFPPGACVRTLLAQIGVVLSRPHEREGFELLAARPMEAYLTAWLEDARLGAGA